MEKPIRDMIADESAFLRWVKAKAAADPLAYFHYDDTRECAFAQYLDFPAKGMDFYVRENYVIWKTISDYMYTQEAEIPRKIRMAFTWLQDEAGYIPGRTLTTYAHLAELLEEAGVTS